jgi:hypothetical protein
MSQEAITPMDDDIITLAMEGREDQVFSVKELKETLPGWT